MKINNLLRRFNAATLDYGIYYLLSTLVMMAIIGQNELISRIELVNNIYLEFSEKMLVVLEQGLAFDEIVVNSSNFMSNTLFELTVKIIVAFLLFIIYPIFFRGQTPGQRLMKVISVKVVKKSRTNEIVIRALVDRWLIVSLSLVFSVILTDIVTYVFLQSFIFIAYTLYVLINMIVISITNKSLLDYAFSTKMLVIRKSIAK